MSHKIITGCYSWFLSVLVGWLLLCGQTYAKQALDWVDVASSVRYFEQNQGQLAPNILFVAQHPQYTVVFKSQKVEVKLRIMTSPTVKQTNTDFMQASLRLQSLQWQHLETNDNPKVQGLNQLSSYSHYYRGNHRQHWAQRVKHFQRVVYRELYPGIDLVYYFNEGQLEFDYIVAPYANPQQIKLNITGADKLSIGEQGGLHLQTTLGELVQQVPYLYQSLNGNRIPVAGQYQLLDEYTVGFRVAKYQPHIPLVIDPIIHFATYLGGGGKDNAEGVVQDTQGNIYVTGTTSVIATLELDEVVNKIGEDFLTDDPAAEAFRDSAHGVNKCQLVYSGVDGRPQTVADFDAFLSKFDADGQLLFSVYLGGCGNEGARAISLDQAGNVYVVGSTLSVDFPTSDSAYQRVLSQNDDPDILSMDMFVSKFTPHGEMVYSTYLGGKKEERARDIEVDRQGRAYVLGNTASINLAEPCQAAALPVFQCEPKGKTDVLLARISPEGKVISTATYLGGSDDDFAVGLALEYANVENDQLNNAPVNAVYVTGVTQSADFFPVPPSFRAFRSSTEACQFINDTELTRPCHDIFIVKLTNRLTTLDFGTFLGGDKDDRVFGIALDSPLVSEVNLNDPSNPDDDYIPGVYITGITYSSGFMQSTGEPLPNIIDDPANQLQITRFPLFDGLPRNSQAVNSVDIFITKLTRDGRRLLVSSLLPGSASDVVAAIAVNQVDKRLPEDEGARWVDEIYLVGRTDSRDFAIVDAFQDINLNGDSFLTKLRFDSRLTPNKDLGKLSEEKRRLAHRLDIEFSTLLGGESVDFLSAIDHDHQGNIVLAGGTWSRQFFTTPEAHQLNYQGGESDVFVVKITDFDESINSQHHECKNAPTSLFSTTISMASKRNLFVNEVIPVTVDVKNIDNADNSVPNVRIGIVVPFGSSLSGYDNDRCPLLEAQVLYCTIEVFPPTSIFIRFNLSNPFPGNHVVRAGTISPCSDRNKTNWFTQPDSLDMESVMPLVLVEKPQHGAINFWVIFVLNLMWIWRKGYDSSLNPR